MPAEPPIERSTVFVDGQNLFHGAREAFGYTYPNYDRNLLAQRLCQAQGWQLQGVRFHTGVPDAADDSFWNGFPFSPTTPKRRGIERTDWIRIDRATYDACIDRRDYRVGGASRSRP